MFVFPLHRRCRLAAAMKVAHEIVVAECIRFKGPIHCNVDPLQQTGDKLVDSRMCIHIVQVTCNAGDAAISKGGISRG